MSIEPAGTTVITTTTAMFNMRYMLFLDPGLFIAYTNISPSGGEIAGSDMTTVVVFAFNADSSTGALIVFSCFSPVADGLCAVPVQVLECPECGLIGTLEAYV